MAFATMKTSMKKTLFFVWSLVAVVLAFGLVSNSVANAAVGKNTCIISSCHASDKPACARETKLSGLVCSMQAEAADFCISFIKCGTNKKGQCVVSSDKAFNVCKSCVSECLGEGAANDAPIEQRISCQRQCVVKANPPPPPKAVSVKKTK